MKKLSILFAVVFFAGLSAAEPVCHKCEVIREQNAKRTDYYEFYDDYLKDNPAAKEESVKHNQNPSGVSESRIQNPESRMKEYRIMCVD